MRGHSVLLSQNDKNSTQMHDGHTCFLRLLKANKQCSSAIKHIILHLQALERPVGYRLLVPLKIPPLFAQL